MTADEPKCAVISVVKNIWFFANLCKKNSYKNIIIVGFIFYYKTGTYGPLYLETHKI